MGERGEISVKDNGKEEIEVMDTPDRSKNVQIATSLSKFEESPVFNFLNSLSPIKPVKSLHISQTINPLSFASLPSVFTSPHVASVRESRFLQRQQLPDPSKPEFSFDDRNTVDTNNLNKEANKISDKQPENLDPRTSECLAARESSGECSTLSENANQDYIGSNSILGGPKGKHMIEYGCNSSTLVPFIGEASQRVLYGNELNPEDVSQMDKSKEATSCDWESLISDTLIFESPNSSEPFKNSMDPATNFYPSNHSLGALESSEQVEEQCEAENSSTQPGEGSEFSEKIGNVEDYDTMADPCMNHPSSISNYENLSSFYRGIRRRCLVFEMGTARRRYLDENSNPDYSIMVQTDANPSSNGHQQLIPTGTDSSRRVLPGIGLHLNALATNSKDYKIVNHKASASGRLLIGPSSSLSFPPPTAGQELSNTNPSVATLEGEIDTIENHVLLLEDVNQISGNMGSEEPGQTSPKKKKRKLEQGGESEACKRCNCKKSKCLKLYCECFAAGVYCVEPCACIECFNKPIHEDTVLATRKQIESRNPLAFAPKVIRASDSIPEIGDDPIKTPASARHKRGCNCKKSGCLKKYCECFQGGVGCSINCRCEGCKNAFGRKDGSCVIAMEEYEEDETEATDNNASLEKNIQKDLEQNTDPVLPETPLAPGRYEISAMRQLSAQNSFSSKKNPPRSSFPSIGSSSSSSYPSQGFAKPSFFPPPPKFDQPFETVMEDEIPEFLQVSSPVCGVKSSSPNRKRVSPPHGAGMSPGLRSSRKLILQSIPSFPSLTLNQ